MSVWIGCRFAAVILNSVCILESLVCFESFPIPGSPSPDRLMQILEVGYWLSCFSGSPGDSGVHPGLNTAM